MWQLSGNPDKTRARLTFGLAYGPPAWNGQESKALKASWNIVR